MEITEALFFGFSLLSHFSNLTIYLVMEARANVRTELMDRAEILHSAIQQLREEENNNKKKIITSSTNILEEEEEEEEGEQHLLARLLSQVRMRTTSDSNPKRYNLICYLSFRREQLFHF